MALNSVVAKASSIASNNVTVYTVPADKQFANVSLNLTNNGGSASAVRVAVSTAASPAAVDYLEYGVSLPANGGSLRRTNMVLSASEKIIVWADSNNVGIRAFGLEQI